MRWGIGAWVAAVAAVAAGCGSSTGSSIGSGPNGQALFVHACGGCHTLSGKNSASHQGGDLLAVRLSRPVMLEFAREMPVRRPLTAHQLGAVTDYILAVQRQRG
jgi:hypothetical protein